MQPILIPDILDTTQSVENSGLLYFDYRSNQISIKSKVKLSKFVFCFLNEGQKEIHSADTSMKLNKGEGFVLPATNCLMTEKTSPLNEYRSVLLFVNPVLIQQFVLKNRTVILEKSQQEGSGSKTFCFKQDAFIKLYLQSMSILHDNGLPCSLAQLKVEELLMYLLGKYKTLFAQFLQDTNLRHPDVSFRKIIENCVEENHTLEELAFLCNMSLSTFKRRFIKVFHKSPHQWFLDKKMEKAAILLKNEDRPRPSDIYVDMGFDSLSSFIYAFRQKYGTTPKRYQERYSN